MASTLPPDPYKALGVTKDAKLPEIRSAHRKLVLKCHPDKVQDAALKAIKQDEFQKVQQAYELLSDETRRSQYDDQVKLFELRKEMGRGNPTPRSNPFEYEVRTAEPRPSTYSSKPTATPKPAPASSKPYERPVPRSYEDLYEREEPRPTARPSKSQEYERKPRSSREDEKERLRRKQKEDDERAKWEKESKRAAHGEKSKSSKRDKEKSSDKERKRASEEKYTRMTYVEEDSSDDYHVSSSRPRSTEKKMKERMEAEIKMREEQARAAEKVRKQQEEESERTRKLNRDKDFAAQYMQAARRKVQPLVEEDFESPRPQMRRAETFAAPSPSYNIRYATPAAPQKYSDEEDTPRRSSARTSSRRAAEAPVSSSRSRDVPKTSSKESRRSPPAESRRERDPYIVEPPSPPTVKKPSLQSHKSAPPVVTASRKDPPTRSKTMQPQFSRSDSNQPPALPRASTFQSGDRGRAAASSSKLKATHGYSSDSSSDSDSPVYTPAPKVRSPSPSRYRHAAHATPEPTRYIIESGRSVPVASHRSELREDRYLDPRDRSESPRGGRHTEKTRPPLTRSGSRQAPRSSSHAQAYYPPDPPTTVKPVVMPTRPKMQMPPREQPTYRSSSSKPVANYTDQVKFAPSYGPEHVVFNSAYGRANERNGYDSYPAVRGVRESVYA